MEVDAAGRGADWIADRSSKDRRNKENCFVGGSHRFITVQGSLGFGIVPYPGTNN
jgi:hypothetical protein